MAADKAPASRSAILTFHSLDRSGSVVSFDPESFRARMEALAESGTPVVSLTDSLRRPGTIALTFDDGFANFATSAWPVLQRLGFAATLFVVSGCVGRTNGWTGQLAGIPELPLLDWPSLRELVQQGLELGAHSHTHPDLTRLAAAELTEELTLPLRLIEEHTGTPPTAFAYPFGKINAQTRAHAAALYELACGTSMGYWSGREDIHDLPRLDAYYLRGSVGPADVLGSRGQRWMAARAFARRARALVAG